MLIKEYPFLSNLYLTSQCVHVIEVGELASVVLVVLISFSLYFTVELCVVKCLHLCAYLRELMESISRQNASRSVNTSKQDPSELSLKLKPRTIHVTPTKRAEDSESLQSNSIHLVSYAQDLVLYKGLGCMILV